MAEMRPPEPRTGDGLSQYIVGAVMGDGLIGSRLAGRYRRSGHPVALEEIPHELLNRPDFIERLAAAGERATALEHPNCLAVYDLVRGNGRLYLVTELVRGRTLAALLGNLVVMPPASALVIADSLLAGLTAAHRLGLVHGDVCPEVVMVTQSGEVRLGGFGLAEVLAADPRLVGWPAVEPPEGRFPSVAADLYAVAALVREMLTGARAGQAASPISPEPVDAVLARALDPDPGRRLTSAADLRDALDTAATQVLGDAWGDQSDLGERVARPMTGLPRPRAQALPPGPPGVDLPGAAGIRPAPPPRASAPRQRPAPRPATPRRRLRGLLILLLAVAVIGGAAAALIVAKPWAAPSNNGPLQISGVTLSVAPAQGGCDTSFTFTASGQVSGAGTITYRWEPADTAASPDYKVQITPDEGSFRFTWGLRIQASQHPQGSVTFHILSPQQISTTKKVTYACP